MPPRWDTEFWEPRALALLALLEQHGPMTLKGVKEAMARKGHKVGITVNLLSYLALTDRAVFSRERKEWRAIKS